MIDKILKHKVIILYMLFGVLTTAVNVGSYFIFKKVLELSTPVSNMLAWLLSVIFAFVTNKLYVFDSQNTSGKETAVQFAEFFGARLLSGVADTIIIVVFVDKMLCSEIIVKLLSNVFVIIFNYVASKFLIFRQKK